MSKLAEIPQPKGLPVLGHLTSFNPNAPVQSLMRLSKELGPIYRLRTWGRNVIIVGSQELAAELCDETRFCKALHPPLAELRMIGNDGLFTADDTESNWGKAHRLLAPAFGPLGLRSMFSNMIDVVDQMLVRWERFGSDAEIDVADNMTRRRSTQSRFVLLTTVSTASTRTKGTLSSRRWNAPLRRCRAAPESRRARRS
ncbi:cytochrome P450 [Ensifer aridi]|uniref:cytochrome P450 n=1 Tax=Ensifer aridi TaxID=1708715 RepID=UPI000A103D5C|nr:cytochrome P450 [Ensifer aridi]